MALGDLTLNSHVYTFQGIENGLAKWRVTSGGVFTGFRTLNLGWKDPIANAKVPFMSESVHMEMPVVTTGEEEGCCLPVGQLQRRSVFDVRATAAPNGTLAERTDDLATFRAFIASASFGNTFLNLGLGA